MSDFNKQLRIALSKYASFTHVPRGLETSAEMTMDEAIDTIKQAVATHIIGEDEKSVTTKPKPMIRYIDDEEGNPTIKLKGGTSRTVDIKADSCNELRAEQRQALNGDKS